MSQDSSVSLPSSSQSTESETPAPTPAPQWTIWSRGINPKGDWYCTHKFTDEIETYHYVNESGTVYMTHRDGSATYVPTEGSYIPHKERDPNSKLPAPTMEEIIEEYKNIKKEHREYLARPLKYWNGVCTSLRTSRAPVDLSWLFPTCDCGDRYSMYGEDYSDYDYEYDYEYEDDYDMVREAYETYGLDFEGEEENYSDDDRDSEDSESEEYKPIIKQEDDKTTVRMTDGAHPSAVEEVKVDVKQEIKEETCDGLVTENPADPMLEKGATSASSVPDTAPEPAVTGTGTGEQTSRGSGIGPDVQTEGKRILRSHRSKPY